MVVEEGVVAGVGGGAVGVGYCEALFAILAGEAHGVERAAPGGTLGEDYSL